MIEMGPRDPAAEGYHLRYRVFGQGDWINVDTDGETCHGPKYIEQAIADFVRSTKAGKVSEVGAAEALDGTEIIFAIWHSSRTHGVVELPLRAEDNALDAMVRAGQVLPR